MLSLKNSSVYIASTLKPQLQESDLLLLQSYFSTKNWLSTNHYARKKNSQLVATNVSSWLLFFVVAHLVNAYFELCWLEV